MKVFVIVVLLCGLTVTGTSSGMHSLMVPRGSQPKAAGIQTSKSQSKPEESTGKDAVKLDNLAPHLIKLMRAGVDILEPNSSFTKREERETLFAGSYDWHSCVIAYWALLVHARTHKDTELTDWVLARLTPEALLKELTALEARERRRHITYPYDEAWLAMLLAEVARQAGDKADPLLKPRQELETRLLKSLEESNFPEFGEKRALKYCGFYRSLLFLYLSMRWTRPCLPDTEKRLDQWAKTALEPRRDQIAAVREVHPFDFLSVPALLGLVDRLDPKQKDVPAYEPVEFQGWPESVKLRTVHVLGLELTRVWPLAVDAGRNKDVQRVYQSRVESLLARPELWSQDFEVCSHWMPQYLFIGEWLRAGRP